MIKTKCASLKPEPGDGTRIFVARRKFPWVKCDEWIKEVAPSWNLLKDYNSKRIDFSEYTPRYFKEMEDQMDVIKELAQRARSKTITLLCYEKTDEKCHRRLLKKLIEKFI